MCYGSSLNYNQDFIRFCKYFQLFMKTILQENHILGYNKLKCNVDYNKTLTRVYWSFSIRKSSQKANIKPERIEERK